MERDLYRSSSESNPLPKAGSLPELIPCESQYEPSYLSWQFLDRSLSMFVSLRHPIPLINPAFLHLLLSFKEVRTGVDMHYSRSYLNI